MFNLSPDQIVLGLPPNDGDSDVIARTGKISNKPKLSYYIKKFLYVAQDFGNY